MAARKQHSKADRVKGIVLIFSILADFEKYTQPAGKQDRYTLRAWLSPDLSIAVLADFKEPESV